MDSITLNNKIKIPQLGFGDFQISNVKSARKVYYMP